MSFQICIKTDRSLHQLAAEIRELFSLPPFTETSFAGAPYCQFEMLGMQVLIHWVEEEERDPEVADYPYRFDLQLSFTENNLNTDIVEYQLQPYYAQLLAYRLGIETACHERQKVGHHWQVRYCYYQKNPSWKETILYGEPGWEPAVKTSPPSQWRSMLPDLLRD
jgi:hypothetical protein